MPCGSREEDFLKFVNVFLQFHFYLPLEKSGALHLFSQGWLQPSLVEIGPVVLEKKMKMWKFYDNANKNEATTTTDNFWSEKLTWTFGSGELKKKESI